MAHCRGSIRVLVVTKIGARLHHVVDAWSPSRPGSEVVVEETSRWHVLAGIDVTGAAPTMLPSLPADDFAALVLQHLELRAVLVVQERVVLGVEVCGDGA